jgi:hypothetical protein
MIVGYIPPTAIIHRKHKQKPHATFSQVVGFVELQRKNPEHKDQQDGTYTGYKICLKF